jgi:SAM-dependent methyltransferase
MSKSHIYLNGQEDPFVLSRNEIKGYFENTESQPSFLNFGTRFEVSNSKPIINREKATTHSFSGDSVDSIAGLEGAASFTTIVSVVKKLMELSLIPKLSGIGIELGSGIGLLSAAMLKLDEQKKINGILAIEASMPFVKDGINIVRKQILKDDSARLIPCYGTFESISVESQSIDFIFQIEALHHANDLKIAANEAFRILKLGGFLISIDRSWPDNTKRTELEKLLSHKYPKVWLIEKGFPADDPFTRRDNGEHEYLDSDWKQAFGEAGFTLVTYRKLHTKIEMWHIVKRTVGLLGLSKMLGIRIPSPAGVIRGFFFQKIPVLQKIGGVIVVAHPRNLTLSVWKKL